MYKIKTYNKISKTGLEVFDDKYTVGDEVDDFSVESASSSVSVSSTSSEISTL